MRAVMLSAIGLCSTLTGGCGQRQLKLPHTVTDPLPVLDSALQLSMGHSRLEITTRHDNVFGCFAR